MDLKKAYDILGVPENATKEEVDQKYFLWIKKSENADFEQINQAYKLIHSHLRQQSATMPSKGPLRDKADHFFYYYKFHLLIGVIAIAVIISIAHTVVEKVKEANRPPAQVNVMLYGESQGVDTDQLEKNILSSMPEWQRVDVTETFVPVESGGPYDMAIVQKSVVILATDKSEIYIIDQNQFDRLSAQQFFHPLDELESLLDPNSDSNQPLYAQTEKDSTKHLYGIRIADNEIFKDTGITPNQRIVTIRNGTKNVDNALKLIQKLIGPPA